MQMQPEAASAGHTSLRISDIAEPPQFVIHKWSAAAGFVSHVAFVDEFTGPYPLS